MTAPVGRSTLSPGRRDGLSPQGANAGSKAGGFKPTPVDFDFVIGKSSVKKAKPRPKPKKKASTDEKKGKQETGGKAKPPLAPGAGGGGGAGHGGRSGGDPAARRAPATGTYGAGAVRSPEATAGGASMSRSKSADPRPAAKHGSSAGAGGAGGAERKAAARVGPGSTGHDGAGTQKAGAAARSPSSPAEAKARSSSTPDAAVPKAAMPPGLRSSSPAFSSVSGSGGVGAAGTADRGSSKGRLNVLADWAFESPRAQRPRSGGASSAGSPKVSALVAAALEEASLPPSRGTTPRSDKEADTKAEDEAEDGGDGHECEDAESEAVGSLVASPAAAACLARMEGPADSMQQPARAEDDAGGDDERSVEGSSAAAPEGMLLTSGAEVDDGDLLGNPRPSSSGSASAAALPIASTPRSETDAAVGSSAACSASPTHSHGTGAEGDPSEVGSRPPSAARGSTAHSLASDVSRSTAGLEADRPGSNSSMRSASPRLRCSAMHGATTATATAAAVPSPGASTASSLQGAACPASSQLASTSSSPTLRPTSQEEARASSRGAANSSGSGGSSTTASSASGSGAAQVKGDGGRSSSRPHRTKREAKAIFDAAAAAGAEAGETQQRPARRPPLPHDALRAAREPAAVPRSKQAFELDFMGLDPKLVERGGVTSYSTYFPNIQSIFTWGQQRCADTAEKRDRYLRDALELFAQFCNVLQALETQFRSELVPLDRATPGTTQQVLSAMDSRGAGLYGVFLKGVIDRVSDAPSPAVPRPLAQSRDVFSTRYYKVVQNRTEVYDIVTRVFHKKEGWEELPHGLGLANAWNLCWTWSKPQLDYSRLCVWQKVNHFPENKHLTRKDCLKRCFDRYIRLGGKLSQYFRICPLTFVLPKEYCLFIDTFQKVSGEDDDFEEQAADAGEATDAGGVVSHQPCGGEAGGNGNANNAGGASAAGGNSARGQKPPNLWIMKPAGSSRGRGIQVIDDLSSVAYGEITIIQQYISDPYLLGGYKWDMRTYVTVTSFNPLEAFIYRDGFARFTTVPYTTDSSNVSNALVHLTNSSIQRHNEESMMQGDHRDPTVQARQRDAILGGTKISFPMLRERLEAQGVSWNLVWSRMIEVVLKSLAMAEGHIPNQVNSFELFGYDLMLDSKLRVWLIEVNSSPSMGQEHLLDEQVKQPLIAETIDLVDPMAFDRRRLTEALYRRLERKAATGAAGGQQQLDIDLHSMLEGRAPRRFGVMPDRMGNYERIAPGEAFDVVAKHRSMCFHSKSAG